MKLTEILSITEETIVIFVHRWRRLHCGAIDENRISELTKEFWEPITQFSDFVSCIVTCLINLIQVEMVHNLLFCRCPTGLASSEID